MEKKRISIVINPQYMKANRAKIEPEQAESDKVYNRYDRDMDLKHNNYVRNFFGERYFGKGYHKQNIPDKTLTGALTYIMTYDYDKLHNPEKRVRRALIFSEEKHSAVVE